MKKNMVQNKYAPRLPEEQINKIVRELSDPNLLLISQCTEEELLLLRVLERKLEEGLIKAEMSKDGKLWLKINQPNGEKVVQIKYRSSD